MIKQIAAAVAAVGMVLIGWATYGLEFIKWLRPDINGFNEAGQWGDTFGGINALFAGMAFSGVLATLWMQQRELSGQKEQMGRERRDQHLQLFDSTFFQLLGLLRDLRSEVRAGPTSGTSAFRFYQEANERICQHPDRAHVTKDYLAERFVDLTRMHHENTLGPFFRIIYTILRRVSEDKALSDREKAQYGNLVRSHLSTAEVALTGLNGLTTESNDFAKYVTEFRLLKYLPDSGIKFQLQRFYPAETFEARD